MSAMFIDPPFSFFISTLKIVSLDSNEDTSHEFTFSGVDVMHSNFVNTSSKVRTNRLERIWSCNEVRSARNPIKTKTIKNLSLCVS